MKTRTISSAVLLPIGFAAIIVGRWFYLAVIAILATLASAEYAAIFKQRGYSLKAPLVLSPVYTWLAVVALQGQAWLGPALVANVFIVILYLLHQRHQNPLMEAPTEQWALTVAGGLYIGMGAGYLIELRALPEGLWWTLLALPVIWISESAAYFIGSRWGRHKMSPTISPGKSWEGYAAEVFSGALTGLALGWLLPFIARDPIRINIWNGLILGIILSAICTAGDFFISVIKREVHLKDTSNLIPGHGGVLDRIDSLLWTGVITWTFVQLL